MHIIFPMLLNIVAPATVCLVTCFVGRMHLDGLQLLRLLDFVLSLKVSHLYSRCHTLPAVSDA